MPSGVQPECHQRPVGGALHVDCGWSLRRANLITSSVHLQSRFEAKRSPHTSGVAASGAVIFGLGALIAWGGRRLRRRSRRAR